MFGFAAPSICVRVRVKVRVSVSVRVRVSVSLGVQWGAEVLGGLGQLPLQVRMYPLGGYVHVYILLIRIKV